MKIVVDKMPERAVDCIRHEIHENGVGDRWNGCQGKSIACPGVKKCPFYIGLEDTMRKGKGDGNG